MYKRKDGLWVGAVNLGYQGGELKRKVYYCKTRNEVSGKLVLSETKTKTSRRILGLPDSLITKLREHRTRQLEEKMLAGSRRVESGLVFTTGIGTPIDPRHVKRRLEPRLKKAGLPHYRVHDLRHFCASLLLAQGMPLKVVSEILGHSQISITADLYTHVLPSMRKEAITLMDSILTGTD